MSKSPSRIKITDIAARAGVSAGTVDRVIHNRGEVSAATRKRILEIISEVNYQPDILASTLASKKSYRFASLLPEPDAANPFWAIPAQGLQKAYGEIAHFGITLEEYNFPYHREDVFSAKMEDILNDPPSGLILAPVFTQRSAGFLEQLHEMQIPVVLINTFIESRYNVAFVGQDEFSSGKVAARLLDFCLGNDQEIFIINMMSEKGGNSHIQNRERGFRDYFNSGNKGRLPKLVSVNVTSQDLEEMEKIFADHLSKDENKKKSIGVFVSNSRVFQVAEFARKTDLKNVKLIGYDLLEQNQQFLRDGYIHFLISQQPQMQGYVGVMALFNHLVMKKEVVKDHFLPIDIITKENIDFYINR